jgi:hypothetical protein
MAWDLRNFSKLKYFWNIEEKEESGRGLDMYLRNTLSSYSSTENDDLKHLQNILHILPRCKLSRNVISVIIPATLIRVSTVEKTK